MMNEVVQVRIGPQGTVGIIGLWKALAEVAEGMKSAPDEIIGKELLARLSKQNYISENATVLYERAFLRAYKKYIGEPLVDEAGDSIEIKVLGPGCPQCERLAHEVMSVIAETGIAAALDHVRDAAEISQYGVMGMPALIINDKVKAIGAAPTRAKIKAWIVQAAKE